jgi:UDP-2,4-diacetamido-2,4,6-trideoxy-beta-L-altropyranose hydrolase
VAFAMRDPPAAARAWVIREGHRVILIEGDEIAASRDAADGAALVVVDGYDFDASWHEALRRPDRRVCVVDDLAGAPVRGDAVLNGNLFGEKLDYDLRPGALRLLGPSYALVRDEFVTARAARAERPTVASGGSPRLFVTMGGADAAGATELALEALERLPACDVRLVVGGANPRLDAITDRASRLTRHSIEVLVDVRDMSEGMLWCDVALTAAGSTCLELACVGVAAVNVVVAENQVPVAAELATRGLMPCAGRVPGVHPEAIASAIAALFGDAPRRAAVEREQRATVDGKGAERAAEALLALGSSRDDSSESL